MKIQKFLVAGGLLLCFAREALAQNTYILATGRRDPRMYAIDPSCAWTGDAPDTSPAAIAKIGQDKDLLIVSLL
jgi:hypothetical protein